MTGHATNVTLNPILTQDVRRFLESIVPSGHVICIARQRTDPDYGEAKLGWTHGWYGPDAEAGLTKAIDTGMTATSTNTYFAVAGYDTSRDRKAINVKAIKCLLLDVDVGKGEGFIPNKPQVMAELHKLHVACPSLPKPWIVDSGNGIHIYYAFDKAVTTAVWGPLSSLFRDVVRAVAPLLIADPVRTCDAASVMRLPGSWNAKQHPRLPVLIKVEGEEASIEEISATLASVASKHNVSGVAEVIGDTLIPNLPSLPAYMNGVGEAATFGGGLTEHKEYAFTDLNLRPIADGCLQMRQVLGSKGNVDEPLWVLFLRVLATVKDSEKVAVHFSSGHPTSSPSATVRKLRHIRQNFGAATAGCKEFKAQLPSGCFNCPHAKKVWTPSQLGLLAEQEERIEAAREEAIESAASGIVTPQGYMVQPKDAEQVRTSGRKDEMTLLPVRQPGKDASYDSEVVIHGHVNLIRSTAKLDAIVIDNEEEGTITDVNVHFDLVTQGRTNRAVCAVGDLSSTGFDRCTDILRKKGLVFEHGLAKHNSAQHYLLDLVKSANHNRHLYRPIKGWLKTGRKGEWSFVAGARHYLPRGRAINNVTSSEHYGWPRRNEGFMERAMTGVSKGRLDRWQTAMNVYNGRNLEVAQLLLLSGLSNLLMPLITHDKGGIVLALTGGSGKGKTTLLRFMSSFMGDHTRYIVPGSSTPNAIGMLLQQANCMLLPVDDTLARDGEVFSALLTMVTGGAEKARMTWDAGSGGSVPYDEGFNASLLLTSNFSTSAAIGMSKNGGDQLQAEAARTRTLEFPATDIINPMITKDQWTRAGNLVGANYGQAADLFMRYVVDNQVSVHNECIKLESEIAERIRQSLPDEKAGQVRFWARYLAVTGTTARIVCDKLGLLPWDWLGILAAGEALVTDTVDISKMDDAEVVDNFWQVCCEDPTPQHPAVNFVEREANDMTWHSWRVATGNQRRAASNWPLGLEDMDGKLVVSAAAAARWRCDTTNVFKVVGPDQREWLHSERTVHIPMNELKSLVAVQSGRRLAVSDWSDLYTRLAAAGCLILGVKKDRPDVLESKPSRALLSWNRFQTVGTGRGVVEIRFPPVDID